MRSLAAEDGCSTTLGFVLDSIRIAFLRALLKGSKRLSTLLVEGRFTFVFMLTPIQSARTPMSHLPVLTQTTRHASASRQIFREDMIQPIPYR